MGINKKLANALTGLVIVFSLGLIAMTQEAFFVLFKLPLVQPDSGSYFGPAFQLAFEHGWNLLAVRTPGYPLFIYFCIKNAHSFFYLLAAQHLLALASAVFASVIYYRYFYRSMLMALLVGLFVALHPRFLIYSHTIMSEILYAALFIGTVLLVLWADQHENLRLWGCAGLIAALALIVRPAGWSVLFGFLFWAGIYLRSWKKIRALCCFMLCWAAGLSTLMAYNYFYRGFAGLSQMGGLALFGSYAQFVPVEKISDRTTREILTPIYAEHPSEIQDMDWVIYNEAGPVNALRRLSNGSADLNKRLSQLTRLAVLTHLDLCLKLFASRVREFVLKGSRRPTHLYPKEYSYQRGVDMLCTATKSYPVPSGWINCDPVAMSAEFQKIATTPLYPYEKTAPIPLILWYGIVYSGIWLPLAAILSGLFLCWKLIHARAACLLLSMIGSTIIINNLTQYVDGRYTIPLEPLYAILFFVFIENRVKALLKRAPSLH